MAQDPFGRTPLHSAAMKADLNGIREALAAGVPVDGVERRLGWTPLHFAAEYGAADAAKALLKAGAKIDAQGKDGQTPLWRAVMQRKKSPDGAMVRLLIRAGADPDLADNRGKSPRHVAESMHEFPFEWLEG